MTNKAKWLMLACAMGTLGVIPHIAQADTCAAKDIRPVPANVAVFVEQVRLALRASLKGKTDALVLTEVRDSHLNLPKSYCAQGGQVPLAIGVEAHYTGYTLTEDDGRRAMGVIDLMRREKEEIDKTPVPADIAAEVAQVAAERKLIDEQFKDVSSNRNHPRYPEVQQARYDNRVKSERALKPHTDALRAQQGEVDKKYALQLRQLQDEPRFTLKLVVNGRDFQEPPWLLVGAPGRTGMTTVRVVKVAVDLSGTRGPETRQRDEAFANAAFDRAKLQAMVDGNMPAAEEAQAVIARQTDDMKTGQALLAQRNKARVTAESDERRILQAARNPARTPAPAPRPAVASQAPVPPAETQPPAAAVRANPPVAAAPRAEAPPVAEPAAPPAATPNINPAAILDGVNRLKGLFGR